MHYPQGQACWDVVSRSPEGRCSLPLPQALPQAPPGPEGDLSWAHTAHLAATLAAEICGGRGQGLLLLSGREPAVQYHFSQAQALGFSSYLD